MEGGASIPGGGCRPDHCIRGGREGGREGRERQKGKDELLSGSRLCICAMQ